MYRQDDRKHRALLVGRCMRVLTFGLRALLGAARFFACLLGSCHILTNSLSPTIALQASSHPLRSAAASPFALIDCLIACQLPDQKMKRSKVHERYSLGNSEYRIEQILSDLAGVSSWTSWSEYGQPAARAMAPDLTSTSRP